MTVRLRQPSGRLARSSGFSFVELLFAVMILGIGLIMVAAIFPAGLSQTKSNFDETQISAAARAAEGKLAGSAFLSDFDTADNMVYPLQASTGSPSLVQLAQSNMVNSSDPRYAWVGFYKRAKAAPNNLAQVMFVGVNRSDPFNGGSAWSSTASYNAGAVVNDRGLQYYCTATNTAKEPITPIGATFWEPALSYRKLHCIINGSQITFKAVPPADPIESGNLNALAPGSYVILADASFPGGPNGLSYNANQYRWNGTMYRIADAPDPAQPHVYNFEPGYEFKPDAIAPPAPLTQTTSIGSVGNEAVCYIVGRNYTGTVGTVPQFDGPGLDISYYTSFVALK